MTETVTTLDALRRAILANPEDDIVRGVYADALDEEAGGYSPRAEFIRVQCQLATVGFCALLPLNTVHPLYPSCPGCDRAKPLQRRERKLWNFGATGTWVEGIKPEFDCIQCIDEETISTGTAHTPILVYRRGFVSEVRAPISVLIGGACERCGGSGNGTMVDPGGRVRKDCPACSGTGRTVGVLPGIVQREPVVKVVATDREPSETPSGWAWWKNVGLNDTDTLDADLFARLLDTDGSIRFQDERVCYPTRDLAHSALSAALLAWAKSRVVSVVE